jgi:hypothetical protein
MNLRDLSLEHLGLVGLLAQRRRGNHIDGREAAPANGLYLPVVDPATEMTVAEAPDSDAADVNAAVASARRTFESSAWKGLRPADRERMLYTLSTLIESHADELSALETLQSGKLRGIARMIDVGGGAEFVRYMGGLGHQARRPDAGQLHRHSRPAVGDLHAARTRGRGRCDRAVELSARHCAWEGGARARGRLHRGAQALGRNAAHRVAAGRTGHRGRLSARCAQRGVRTRCLRRCGARRASGHPQDQLHRLDGRGPSASAMRRSTTWRASRWSWAASRR